MVKEKYTGENSDKKGKNKKLTLMQALLVSISRNVTTELIPKIHQENHQEIHRIINNSNYNSENIEDIKFTEELYNLIYEDMSTNSEEKDCIYKLLQEVFTGILINEDYIDNSCYYSLIIICLAQIYKKELSNNTKEIYNLIIICLIKIYKDRLVENPNEMKLLESIREKIGEVPEIKIIGEIPKIKIKMTRERETILEMEVVGQNVGVKVTINSKMLEIRNVVIEISSNKNEQ